ncbi:MAG: 30S ribosomal protein S11 [Bacteroidetes bacterium]|nr:MAG: 30S ribosomal protein S11 [Bacteroidota bacterium]
MAEEKKSQQEGQPVKGSAEAAAKPVKAKKRTVKVDAIGEAHIHAAFNNIIITLTNMKGQTIAWASAGKMGFRGSKKNTPYAATVASSDAARAAYEAGLRKVKVYIKGPGGGREAAMRALYTNKIEIMEIIDLTPIPHNGCRPPKKRRV